MKTGEEGVKEKLEKERGRGREKKGEKGCVRVREWERQKERRDVLLLVWRPMLSVWRMFACMCVCIGGCVAYLSVLFVQSRFFQFDVSAEGWAMGERKQRGRGSTTHSLALDAPQSIAPAPGSGLHISSLMYTLCRRMCLENLPALAFLNDRLRRTADTGKGQKH